MHQTILSSLDFDGHGSLLEVGCGSGALAVRAALTWPEAKITGLDYWGAMYNYNKALCEKTRRPRVSVSNAALSTAMPISWISRTGALML